GQDALAAVSAVAADEEVIVGKPGGNQGHQLEGQFGSGAMVGVGLALGGFGFGFFAFGETLAVAIQPHGDRQGEDFGGGPERVSDNEAQDDPIVSPTDEGFGPAREERIVMHA